MDDGTVRIELTHDEALVLFEFLTRLNQEAGDPRPVRFEDQAEQRVLWDLEAMLERELPVLFHPKYSELLEAARQRVRDPEEEP